MKSKSWKSFWWSLEHERWTLSWFLQITPISGKKAPSQNISGLENVFALVRSGHLYYEAFLMKKAEKICVIFAIKIEQRQYWLNLQKSLASIPCFSGATCKQCNPDCKMQLQYSGGTIEFSIIGNPERIPRVWIISGRSIFFAIENRFHNNQ